MTRVAVVASSPVLRAGLEALLAAPGSLVVVGSVADWSVTDRRDPDAPVSLAELVAPLAPDVVVWVADGGARVPVSLAGDGPGPDAAWHPAVVLLTDLATSAVRRDVLRAVRAGVRGVLPREAGADEIVAAVEAVAAGLLAVAPSLTDDLFAATALEPAAVSAPLAGASLSGAVLTPREREVLALLAQGLANKAIAPRLHISEHTVKAHVASIFEKLSAGTRAEAVVTAARMGLLML